MNARSPRLVRGAILAALLVVGGSIAWTFRRAPGAKGPAPQPSATAPLPAGAARTQNLVYQSVEGARSRFRLTAGEMVGREGEELHLRTVDYQFGYTAKGEPHNASVVADECLYTPEVQKGVFNGHVKLTTDDGAELRTEQLVYRGDKNIGKSELPVEFRRNVLSGTSTGFEYHGEDGTLELPADVVIHVQPQGKPTMEIRSGHAVLLRAEGTMRFTDGVTVSQAGDTLTTDRFELDFGEDQTIYRARAIDNVVLQTSSADTPGAAAGSARHLTCRKLDLWFRPDGSLREGTAVDDAVLTLSSAPKEPRERRKLAAGVITFQFDDAGRLEGLQTLKDTTFTSTPLPPNKALPSTLTCQRLSGQMDPVTGQPRIIEFTKNVAFSQGKQKATGQHAFYDGAKAELFLNENPQLVDSERGTDLTAQAILIGTRTGDVSAQEQVRHLLRSSGRAGSPGFLGHAGAPILLTSRFLEYTAKTRTARYWEGALLRSEQDEVRGREIRLREQEAGARTLEAEGSVISSLHPRSSASGGKAPAPIEARSQKMLYEEARREVSYEGDVSIRQGDIATRSPLARLSLTPEGALESLHAGEPVEVVQGNRRARGTKGVYTPSDETMVLTGDKVVLQDPGQEVEGRSLTFHVGDDRILVDGQEQVRTQTIIRSHKEQPVP